METAANSVQDAHRSAQFRQEQQAFRTDPYAAANRTMEPLGYTVHRRVAAGLRFLNC